MEVIRAHPRVVRQFFEAWHILGLFDEPAGFCDLRCMLLN
jgi:hypothetical protein